MEPTGTKRKLAAAIYDRHSDDGEKRKAMTRWAKALGGMIGMVEEV